MSSLDANRRKLHEVEAVTFKDDLMYLKTDGQEYVIEYKSVSKRLAKADDLERQSYRVSPAGYGIHWPLIDEDLSVDGLIRVATKVAGG